jgi:hypothetical protein
VERTAEKLRHQQLSAEIKSAQVIVANVTKQIRALSQAANKYQRKHGVEDAAIVADLAVQQELQQTHLQRVAQLKAEKTRVMV